MIKRNSILIFLFIGIGLFVLGGLGMWKLHQQAGADMEVIRNKPYVLASDSGYLDTLLMIQSQLDYLESQALELSFGKGKQKQGNQLRALSDTIKRLNVQCFTHNRHRFYQDSVYFLAQKRLGSWARIFKQKPQLRAGEPNLGKLEVKGSPARNTRALPDSIPIEDNIAIFKWVFSRKYRNEVKQQRRESVEKVLLDWQEAVLSEEGEPDIREKEWDTYTSEIQKVSLEEQTDFLKLFYESKFYANKMDFYVQKIRGKIHAGALEKQAFALRKQAEHSLSSTFDYLFKLIFLLGSGIFLCLFIVVLTHRMHQNQLQRRELFVSKVVHEIKNTLHPIIGFASTLDQSYSHLSVKDVLGTVREESQHLLYLANGILDLSQIRQNEFTLTAIPFVLQEIVNLVINSHRLEAKDKGIQLRVRFGADLPKVVIGDPDRLKQILRNVISNAIKHTKEGEVSVEVTLGKVKISKAFIQFSVIDTGEGLTRKELRKISRFRQFNNLGEKGVGLGLAISHQLIRQHKGKIKLRSKGRGQGLEVGFSLPYPIGATQDILFLPPKSPVGNPYLNELCMLLVDDDPMNLELTGTWIKNMGGKVHTASNGKEAQDLLPEISPALIILDLHMPEMDGKEFIEWLKSDSEREVPILVCSGEAEQDLIKEIETIGANGFISKPYGKEELLVKIKELLLPEDKKQVEESIPNKRKPELGVSIETTYAIEKLHQEFGSNRDELNKKVKLLTEVCRDSLEKLYLGMQTEDAKLMNKALHKMLMVCKYLGEDFEKRQADLELRTQAKTLKNKTLALSRYFYHLMRNEVEKLDAYLKLEQAQNELV